MTLKAADCNCHTAGAGLCPRHSLPLPGGHTAIVEDAHEALTFHPLPVERSVLLEAQGLVHGARNVAYGHPLDDFTRTAAMASAMLGDKLKAPLTAEDVGMFMCLVKLSRQVNAPKRDNMVDLAGYAETVQWCHDEREARAA